MPGRSAASENRCSGIWVGMPARLIVALVDACLWLRVDLISVLQGVKSMRRMRSIRKCGVLDRFRTEQSMPFHPSAGRTFDNLVCPELHRLPPCRHLFFIGQCRDPAVVPGSGPRC
jgi:hypothetical protein